MSDKPTENDLIKLELRDLLASVGELRLAVGALMERVERLERGACVYDYCEKWKWPDCGDSCYGSEGCHQLNEPSLEDVKAKHEPRTMTGSVQGLEGVFTITPPPEWE